MAEQTSNGIAISVIIPVYNCAPYLDKCLRELCVQLRPNVEIILVDDGSSDASGVKCDEYAGNYYGISVIHQKNQGVSMARNAGLNKAVGQYITFVDADDWVAPDYFAVLLKNIEEHKSEFYYFNFKYMDGEDIAIEAAPLNLESNIPAYIIYELWESYRHLTCCFCLFARDIIENFNIRFTPNRRYGEDQEFVFKALLSSSIVSAINVPLYYYRKNQESAMFKITYNQFQDIDAMREVLEYAYRKTDCGGKLYSVYYNHRFVHSVYVASYHLLRAGESPSKVLSYLKNNDYIAPLKKSRPSLPKYRRFQRIMSVSPFLCLCMLYLRGLIARFAEKL